MKTNCPSSTIGHFTVVCPVTWPMNGCEAAGDLVLTQTSLLLSCKLSGEAMILAVINAIFAIA